jgi:hypothetical protein
LLSLPLRRVGQREPFRHREPLDEIFEKIKMDRSSILNTIRKTASLKRIGEAA